jgi:3-deoxy-D-manno-octulosonic-acid transferase
MPFAYNIALGAYHMGVRLMAPFKPKAKAWVEGRRGLWQRLETKSEALLGCVWMHCASVGEFEQGRPVLEKLRKERPDLPVLLTFFSPSGYEARKDYPGATHVDYLPADGPENADHLLKLIRPCAAIFIKYEFWYHHLGALKARNVPTFLVSAIFRKGQPFFQWYGGAWRKMLACYDRIFVQDEASRELLSSVDCTNVTVSGDTRFDRVMAIVQANEGLSVAKAFRSTSNAPVLICGSTWPEDERIIVSALKQLKAPPRIIIAPHEVTEKHVDSIEASFPPPIVKWSISAGAKGNTLLMDVTGSLARAYRYGDIAYVGGGFGDGIHSLLEAAAWGKPVIFGPKHTKFAEAQGLIDAGGGWCIKDAEELRTALEPLLNDPAVLRKASEAAGRYVRERVGAAERVMSGLRSAIR